MLSNLTQISGSLPDNDQQAQQIYKSTTVPNILIILKNNAACSNTVTLTRSPARSLTGKLIIEAKMPV